LKGRRERGGLEVCQRSTGSEPEVSWRRGGGEVGVRWRWGRSEVEVGSE